MVGSGKGLDGGGEARGYAGETGADFLRGRRRGRLDLWELVLFVVVVVGVFVVVGVDGDLDIIGILAFLVIVLILGGELRRGDFVANLVDGRVREDRFDDRHQLLVRDDRFGQGESVRPLIRSADYGLP